MPQDSTVVVVCADHGVFPFLVGLLLSLRGLDRGRYAVILIDVGLTPAQLEHVSDLCDGVIPIAEVPVVMPNPDIVDSIETRFPYWRAQFCRPLLPRVFSDHARIIHLDADMWAQNLTFLNAAVEEMRAGRAVVVPECDPSYPFLTSNYENLSSQNKRSRLMEEHLGKEAAVAAGYLPYYNTGFFGAPTDSPLWGDFHDILKVFAAERYHFLSEQIAFNVAVFNRGNTTLFPATCNWICNLARPIRDAEGRWRSPTYPRPEIELLHLSGAFKARHYIPDGPLFDDGRYLSDIRELIDPAP